MERAPSADGAQSHRPASRPAGLGATQRDGGVSRDDLLERGVPEARANSIVFRLHEEEMLRRLFARWVYCFALTSVMSLFFVLFLFLWLGLEYYRYREVQCSSPLQTYYVGVVIAIFFKISESQIVRCFFGWPDSSEAGPQHPPTKVKLYKVIVVLSSVCWDCLGCAWAFTDSANGDLPSCEEVAPGLLRAVKMYSALRVATIALLLAQSVGLIFFLRLAYRRGIVRSSNAAPAGTLEESTEGVSVAAWEEHCHGDPSCPICMEDYKTGAAGAKEVLRLKHCGHIFHKSCLKSWLNVNRTCPLCRVDLTSSMPVGGALAVQTPVQPLETQRPEPEERDKSELQAAEPERLGQDSEDVRDGRDFDSVAPRARRDPDVGLPQVSPRASRCCPFW